MLLRKDSLAGSFFAGRFGYFVKIMTVMMLTVVLGMVGFDASKAEAKSPYELNYFHFETVDVDNSKVLRIEVGVDRALAEGDYKVSENPDKPKQLLIDIPNSEQGKIPSDITLDGDIGRYMTVRELERRHMQLMVSVSKTLKDHQYEVYTAEADRKSKKPFRIVIDVYDHPDPALAEEERSDFQTDGVVGRTIILDPGHGGSDSGAIGPSGLMEKDVTLKVSKRVRDILENSGARVVMTRDTDVDVYGPGASDRQELQARVNVGKFSPGADIFLSVHINAFTSPTAHGTATYYFDGSRAGMRLADYLQDGMVNRIGLTDRGIHGANFYVLKYTSMPAALVELAFITNYSEEDYMRTEEFIDNAAKGICEGLSNYFKMR